jgi:hypothetical protein
MEHRLSVNRESRTTTDMIDGPMLMGIAALITSVVNIITAVRTRDRPADRSRARTVPRRRKGRDNRSYGHDVRKTEGDYLSLPYARFNNP